MTELIGEIQNLDHSGKNDENERKETPEAKIPTPQMEDGGSSATAGLKRSSEKMKGKNVSRCDKSGEQRMNIWTERERRQKMGRMFANLLDLLPHLPDKADKFTIVDATVTYIKKSQETLRKLEKQKEERCLNQHGNIISCYDSQSLNLNSKRNKYTMDSSHSREAFLANPSSIQLHSPICPRTIFPPPEFSTWISPNVVLSISGNSAHINICCAKKIGLLTGIGCFLDKHSLEVVSFQVSSDHYRSMYMIHAQPSGALQELIAYDIYSVEEKFQHAAADIMTYITSM